MPFKHHPSNTLIFSVLNGTAPTAERDRVSAHVAVCARCSSVSGRYGFVLRGLSDAGTHSQNERSPARRGILRLPASRIPRTFLLKAAGGTFAAVVFVLMFAWPRHIQTVSAGEILSRVEAAQDNATGSGHFYRLRMGSTTCSTADAAWAQEAHQNTTPCARARAEIIETPWKDREMLSARSYRRWHDGLSRHRDSIYRQEPYWTIKTDTDQGSLRSASLRVRTSDYRPVELTLEFATLDPISVVEDEPSERRMDLAATANSPVQNPGLQHVEDPADAVEVQAWLLLREIGADSGWEVTIVRDGSKVKVAGLVNDASRQAQITDAFSKLTDVAVDLNRPAFLPQRDGNGDSLPLAESTLEAQIPDAHERGERITQISNASQSVLGKAFFYDRLLTRQRALGESSSARSLNPLIQEERVDLLAAAARLSDLLDPFPEMRGRRILREPLSYAQARSLDAAILSLFTAAPKQSASLQETTSLVRALLPKN
jgi:hypothetical protein